MSRTDQLSRTLEALVPPFDPDAADWDDVLRRAAPERPAPRRPRRRLRALAGALAALVVVCAAVLIDPFGGGERKGILDRALAAVADGPALRVVSETEIGGTLIELDGEGRRELRARRTVLFDPERGMRTIVRLDGTVLQDYRTPVGRRLGYAGEAMMAFTRDYRRALRSGRARVLGEETVRGIPVYWIRVPLGPRSPKSRTPCRPYRFCQDVAISRETYKPVFLSITPPGLKPRLLDRILSVESLPAGTGEIRGGGRAPGLGFDYLPRSLDIGRSRAAELLGTAPAWPGRRIGGLRLGRIDAVGIRPLVFTSEMRRPRYLPRERIIRFVFSSPGEIGSGRPPGSWRPLVIFNQATRLSYELRFGPGNAQLGGPAALSTSPYGYAPPRGWALITQRGHEALLRRRGLFISVLASRKEQLLPALRALTR